MIIGVSSELLFFVSVSGSEAFWDISFSSFTGLPDLDLCTEALRDLELDLDLLDPGDLDLDLDRL